MGRRVPTTETHPIHYALSISLLAAWIAATIAIVAVLCGVRKKPSPPPSESSSVNPTTEKGEAASTSPAVPAPGEAAPPETGVEGEGGSRRGNTRSTETLPLPLPPMLRKNEIGPARISRSASVSQSRRGEMMGGINFPRSLSVARGRVRGRRDKANQSDSIWMKTIILGEKCRVPQDDEQVYDDKGQKIETCRRKGPRSLPVSRSNSFVDPEAVVEAEAEAAPQQMRKGEGK